MSANDPIQELRQLLRRAEAIRHELRKTLEVHREVMEFSRDTRILSLFVRAGIEPLIRPGALSQNQTSD
jgi:hypothetical protein